jgi:hypothetical protein
MKIHNVYTDLLQSCVYFLNNKILTDDHLKIKQFEFNISNSSYQLKYETQVELPAAIVSLQAITQWINHPYVFLHRVPNQLRIPVIYDRTKNIEISLQEEMYTVSVNVTINCESQLQAVEIQHRIQNYLPINKYLIAYEYISYFELDTAYLNKYLIDVDKDVIENLFYKHNKYLDKFDHCFSVEYSPLIRLNACDIGIDALTNSSFQVSCSFEFLTHIPIFIQGPNVNLDNLVSKNHLYYSNIPVPTNNTGNNILIEVVNKQMNRSHTEIIQKQDNEFEGIDYLYDSTLSYNNQVYSARIHLNYDVKNSQYNTKLCFVEGFKINGMLETIKLNNDKLTVFFNGLINNVLVTEFITFEVKAIDYLKKLSLLNELKTYPLYINNFKVLPLTNNIYNSIKNINKSAVKINNEKSNINIIILNDGTEVYCNPLVTINQLGEFALIVNSNNIKGFLDLDTGNIYLDDPLNLVNNIYLNLSFDYIKGIPSSIERINTSFDIGMNIISERSPYKTIQDFSLDYNVLLIPNVNYDSATNRISFNFYVMNPNGIKYKFSIKDLTFDSNSIILNETLSSENELVFDLNNPFIYSKYLVDVSDVNPLYFLFNFGV